MFSNSNHAVVSGGVLNSIQGNLNYYTGNTPLPEEGLAKLRKFTAPGAAHDSQERFPPPRCDPGTREAVLTCIQEWIGRSVKESRILWLYGPAGAGKSAIAQTLADRMAKDNTAVSFFFSRAVPGRNTSDKLWPTIALQLCALGSGLRKAVNAAVSKSPDIFEKSLDRQLSTLVAEPTRSVNWWWSRRIFFLIIDGIDECQGEDQQCAILTSIASIIHEHRLPLRFLIASRPEPHIRRAFDDHDLQRVCYPVFLNERFHPIEDVHRFLRNKFVMNTRPW